MAEPRFNKVKLIPWDPVDERHFQRMCDQRVACGWLTDGISDWKAKVLRGVQTFYWVVSFTCCCRRGVVLKPLRAL